MTETITAIYDEGVLRPLEPLNLHKGQRVRIRVLPEEKPEDERETTIRILVKAGLMRSRPEPETIPPPPLSPEERLALADRLGRVPGKPASEMVIEDRGEL
jgi:predicted DNA-binding antitoxin AbrB/MazE fold protein